MDYTLDSLLSRSSRRETSETVLCTVISDSSSQLLRVLTRTAVYKCKEEEEEEEEERKEIENLFHHFAIV